IVAGEGIPYEASLAMFPRRQVAGKAYPQRHVAGETPIMSLGKAVNVVVWPSSERDSIVYLTLGNVDSDIWALGIRPSILLTILFTEVLVNTILPAPQAVKVESIQSAKRICSSRGMMMTLSDQTRGRRVVIGISRPLNRVVTGTTVIIMIVMDQTGEAVMTTTTATTTTLATTTGVPVMDVTRETGVSSPTDLSILIFSSPGVPLRATPTRSALRVDADTQESVVELLVDKKLGALGRVFAVTEDHATKTSDGEVDAVDDLRVDNSIQNSEHESSESEDSDFDNPSVPYHPRNHQMKNFILRVFLEMKFQL
nr:hypothetical protein [Tanacetum cinerariifolium]